MKVPISWLKDFVEITMSPEDLAERLTLAGLEVGKIHYIGLEGAPLVWDREKLVLGHIVRVEQHPDADKLVLATVDIGRDEPETVVTGAPNLKPFVGQGDVSQLGMKSPFVMEGATVFDGYSNEPGKTMKLKGRKIRGIMNRHMLCSEKELGLSDDHEGIVISYEETAPGTPLVDIWADAILDIDLTPNLVRCSSILGVAREVAALTGQPLRYPTTLTVPEGLPAPALTLHTDHPGLNPRFTALLIEEIELKESPYWMQRRLRLAGMRPISNIVDISNYVMLEMGQPNHAFDWDALRRRADEYNPKEGQSQVQIITRLAEADEEVLTLDGKTRKMHDFSILVTDPKSNLSIGGIMGGGETEVSDDSQNILLEAAAWNFINIRRTSQALNLYSEAGYRFSRGVHPAQSLFGLLRGAQLMVELAGGSINHALVDYYPQPPAPIVIELPPSEVERLLGVELAVPEISAILESLEFQVESITRPDRFQKPVRSETVLRVTVPDHRMDINDDPVIGRADLIEEIARVYGYDRIPVTEMQDELPPQRNNLGHDQAERLRDLLVQIGLQEVITYRLTTPSAENRLLGADERAYIRLANPSTPERAVMRHSLLNSVLEVAAENNKHHDRVQMFEVGHIYLPTDNAEPADSEAALPTELRRLAIVMTGPRDVSNWIPADGTLVDFFDLKGVVEAMVAGLHAPKVLYSPAEAAIFQPGRVATLRVNNKDVGLFGQLHPRLVAQYDFKVEQDQAVLIADIDLEILFPLLPEGFKSQGVSRFPAVQQDIALVVDEKIPADKVLGLIVQTGGALLREVRLFDLFRGEQVGAGKKSLAYSLTFQAEDRTLTDKVVAKHQTKIVKRLERELGAQLRG